MKKSFKRLLIFMFICIAGCLTAIGVKAESAPSTLTATNYNMSSTPMSFPATYKVKKTTDGKYIFCTYYARYAPNADITYTRGSEVSDNGMSYILYEALNASNDNDYFVYQNALWIYMVDQGLMPQPYYDLTVFKSRVNNSSSDTANRIKTLVANAKSASAADKSAPSISVDSSNNSFTLEGNTYVSDEIQVSSSTGSYDVVLTSAPEGSTIEKNGSSFIIKVPQEKINSSETNIEFQVSNSKTVYTAYNYTPSSSRYQTMALAYKDTKTASGNGNLIIKQGGASISKQDISTEGELPGAHLVVKDSEGNIIDEWVSTNEPHIIEYLKPGTYTLTETIAPEGYILSTESITFTVKDDGTTTEVVMYNELQTGNVSISKQDITSKKELPGAHLVVKDYEGNIIDEWVSTNAPHIIKNLKPGIYTLNETIAPNGYILSDETITFVVKEDGSVTRVVMYNTPNGKEVAVENTGTFKTIASSLIGLIVIAAGIVLIIKNKKLG